MPCEHYKDALIEAAAAGATPQGELRAHLKSCPSCGAAFAHERALFAVIDSGLHTAVNAEVPVSLLPRVRARVDEAALPTRSRFAHWYAFAGAAAMVLVFFALRTMWHGNIPEGSSPTVASSRAPSPFVSQPPASSGTPPLATVGSRSAIRRPAQHASAGSLAAFRRGNSNPEVLVPKDQELTLASYAQQWHNRKRAPLATVNPDDTTLAVLEVAPIQIDQLDVKPLAVEKSQ